jgi:hypothetical protein
MFQNSKFYSAYFLIPYPNITKINYFSYSLVLGKEKIKLISFAKNLVKYF